jgi:putative transposase
VRWPRGSTDGPDWSGSRPGTAPSGLVTLGGRRVPIPAPRGPRYRWHRRATGASLNLFIPPELVGRISVERMPAELSTRRRRNQVPPRSTHPCLIPKSPLTAPGARRPQASRQTAPTYASRIAEASTRRGPGGGTMLANTGPGLTLGRTASATRRHHHGRRPGPDRRLASEVVLGPFGRRQGAHGRGQGGLRPARCQIHKTRNVPDHVPEKMRGAAARRMREAYHDDSAVQRQALSGRSPRNCTRPTPAPPAACVRA